MSLSPSQIIATICPELSGSPSLPVYLEMAVEVTDKGFFGSLYNMAIAYRACHLFTIYGDTQGGGGSGNAAAGTAPIASMSEGSVSISYAVSAPATDGTGSDLDNTKFGKMLLSLTKSRPRMGVNPLKGLPLGFGG
jgi:hypothetical protein